MNTKFIKKNIFMLIFMIMSLVIVIALVIMVLSGHGSMKKYDSKKTELLKRINEIVKLKYTPVTVNITRIESDTIGYKKEIKKIQSKFGHPYAWALESFADKLGINLNEFKAKFGEFWKSQKGLATRDLIFRRYKVRQFSEDFPKYKSNWDRAMSTFMQEAQKATLEKISSTNVDGIFLAATGKGRRFSDDPGRCQTFMQRMRFNMIDYFADKKVLCATTDFSFDDSKEPLDGDIERIARAWEIVSDLGKRIADSKVDPKKDILTLLSFSKRGLDGEVDGAYTLYRFNFTVNGDLNTIRRIVQKLYEAYKENRVYALRNIKLTRNVDNVEKILEDSDKIKEELAYDAGAKEDKASKDRGKARKPKDTLAVLKKKIIKKEVKKILGPKDRGYAKVIVGKRNIINAEFEVDYIVFDNSPK
ncbi:MAG: hypothetical protein KOO69_05620 [Victivallales bacterium]|nr:hypothetical protein [Victivallales bacterium]